MEAFTDDDDDPQPPSPRPTCEISLNHDDRVDNSIQASTHCFYHSLELLCKVTVTSSRMPLDQLLVHIRVMFRPPIS
jgi:hypothetical protein